MRLPSSPKRFLPRLRAAFPNLQSTRPSLQRTHPSLQKPRLEPPPAENQPRADDGGSYALALVILALLAFFLSPRAWIKHSAGRKVREKAGEVVVGAATPVVAVQAVKGNIGVYVTGLGAITPIYTVTVKSRVDGQLMKVLFKEGDLVQQGEPLVEIDPRPYEAVVIQVTGQHMHGTQALLANARVDLTRYATLVAQDAVPEQMLATQRALVAQYEGALTNDQGLLEAAALNVTYCHITAPITGIVGLRLVDPGNIVHASDSNGMLVITQIQPISVIFTIGEGQLAPILQKMRSGAKLTVDAWDREDTKKIATGTLATLDNQIDQTTGTLKLRAIFPNDHRELFPNQFVNAHLLQQEKTGVTLLESAAIQRNTNNTYVYLIKPDNTVTVRNVTLGTTGGDQTEITSGLMPGDKVVMTGVDKLQEGSKVIATMNPAGK